MEKKGGEGGWGSEQRTDWSALRWQRSEWGSLGKGLERGKGELGRWRREADNRSRWGRYCKCRRRPDTETKDLILGLQTFRSTHLLLTSQELQKWANYYCLYNQNCIYIIHISSVLSKLSIFSCQDFIWDSSIPILYLYLLTSWRLVAFDQSDEKTWPHQKRQWQGQI